MPAAAPDFELKDTAGKLWSSASLRAKAPALFAFFKISCPVCQLTLPFLERLQQKVSLDQFRIVGISQDDAAGTKRFNHEFGLTFPTLLDTAQAGYPVSNAYRISSVPSLFLVENDGTVSWSSTGFVKADLEALAARFSVSIFRQDDDVPAWKAG